MRVPNWFGQLAAGHLLTVRHPFYGAAVRPTELAVRGGS
jgi:hypothetical protein